jgi:hypothetical protein
MAIIVRLEHVVDAIDALDDEWQTYLDRETGEIVVVTEEDRQLVEDEEEPDLEDYPEWHRNAIAKAVQVESDPDRFLALPDKFEVHEWDMMRRFADVVDNESQRRELLHAIHGSGAFRMFRATINRLGLRDQWFDYRAERFRELAKAWLEDNGIAFTDGTRNGAETQA